VNVGFQTNVGGAVATQVVASPDGGTLYAVTLEGQLVALTLTGEKKWSFALGDRAYGAPAVADDGTIFVGSDKKAFFAITPAGAQIYKLEVDGEADVSPLLTPDGRVVLAAGNTVYEVRKGGDVGERFRASKKVYSAPTWMPDGRVAFGAQDDKLYVLTKTFSLAFAVDLGADVDCSPAALDDGSLVVGTDGGEVVRIDPSGTIAWRTKLNGYVRGGVTITRSGDIVVGTFGPVPRVVRLSDKGAVLGAFEIHGTGARDFGIWGSPMEDDAGSLYFGTQDDRVLGLSASGEPILSFSTKGDVDAPITMLADGSLIVGSEDGTVTRLLP
jgi:outer membrane protein assembly factor BamB